MMLCMTIASMYGALLYILNTYSASSINSIIIVLLKVILGMTKLIRHRKPLHSAKGSMDERGRTKEITMT